MSRVNRFLVPLAGFALLVLLLVVGLKQAPDKGIIVSPLVGKPAPALVLPTLMDPAVTIDAAQLYKGQWYLLNVWGTWCVECRYEHPALLELQKTAGIPILGMDWRDDEANAQQWLKELGNPYDQVVSDKEGRVALAWGVYGAPETYLINPEGIIATKRVGSMTPAIWEKQFLPLMAQRK